MRTMVSGLFGLIATTASAALAVPPPLPIFSFMGQDTDGVYSSTPLKTSCDFSYAETECVDDAKPLFGAIFMDTMTIGYNHGKLYRVAASADQAVYEKLSASLVDRYGPPTSEAMEKAEPTQLGPPDDKVSRWAFKGGELRLDRVGRGHHSCSFEFRSTDNAPSKTQPSGGL